MLGLRDKIFVLQIAKFEVLTGPAADEILELHSVKFMVFAGPASDRIFVLQIARFVVLTGPGLCGLPVTYFRARALDFPHTSFSRTNHIVLLGTCSRKCELPIDG